MRNAVGVMVMMCALATGAWAQSELRVIPPTGATFAPGQRFDLRIEADNIQGQPRQFSIEVNGRDQKREIFGNEEFRTFIPVVVPAAPPRGGGSPAKPVEEINGGVTRRSWSLDRPGKYDITATLLQADGSRLTAKSTIQIENMPPSPARARNVILFIGDGMGAAQRTAARIASKGIQGGRAKGLLEMDQMETTGMVMTASLDALITDSSPGASSWATGNKSSNNWHGVYPDNTGPLTASATAIDRDRALAESFLDNPKVENIAEFLQRTRRMATGVISTVALTDSTPGAFSSHTVRYAQNAIAEQMLSSGHSILLGGGGRYFLPAADPALGNIPSARTDGRNVAADFQKAGYAFASTAAQLKAAARSDKILGLFHGAEMTSRYDRMRAQAGEPAGKEAVGQFPDQPTLEFMTQVALNVLNRNSNGFFLMVEGGSIDREYHRMDPVRAIDETIELDKAIGIARAWAAERGHEETLIIVTADHETSGLVLTGVLENGRASGRAFPDYPDKNFDGFPDTFQPELSLSFDFASTFNPTRERNYELPRNLRDLNPTSTANAPSGGGQAGHSAVDVPIGARGPGAHLFNGVMDNTEVFFRILRALGEK